MVIWIVVYAVIDKSGKKEMLTVSLWTSLLGLTEPIFVPEYWSPPSLFDLANRTGFDIESLMFAFGVGGLAVVIYEAVLKVKHATITPSERSHKRHRYHLPALLSSPIIFVALLVFTDLNPIYSTILALLGGGFATWYCRPDLKKKMIFSALMFIALYWVYFITLIIAYPGYVERVWNLSEISGVLVLGVPLEELLFAGALGFLWSSVYEHIKWQKIAR